MAYAKIQKKYNAEQDISLGGFSLRGNALGELHYYTVSTLSGMEQRDHLWEPFL